MEQIKTKNKIKIENLELPTWDLLDAFFMQGGDTDCSNNIVRHQIESFNEFIDKQLIQIIQGFNSIQVCHNYNPNIGNFKYKIYLNILKPSLVKPVYQTTDGTQMLMTPHLARMNNLTYASNLYVDIHVITDIINDDGVTERKENTITGVCIGKIPIMVRSKACVLSQMPGIAEGDGNYECRYDYGGYFIINGNEKVIISQDRISENKTLVFAPNGNGDGLYAEIRSMPDGMFFPPKTTGLHLSGKSNHMGNIIRLSASFLRAEVPLFLMFRALGIETDKEIYAHIVLDLYAPKQQRMITQLAACAEDACEYHTQSDALTYLLKILGTTGTPKEFLDNPKRAFEIIKNTIRNDFLSHVGHSFKKKALYLGYMVKKLLSIHLGYLDFDNRDSYLHKRIDTPGILFSNLFRQCYGKLIKEVRNLIVRELNLWRASTNITTQLINQNNVHRFFKQTLIETGLRYALSTGNWGVKSIGSFQNIRQGVAQVLNRMSYLSTLSHLRRINTPMEKNGKLVQPRKLENSQYGMICPSETPEGAAVGLVKNIALSTHITVNVSSAFVREIIAELGTELYGDHITDTIGFLKRMGSENAVHIMINGDIVGFHTNPDALYCELKHLKRYGSIPPTTSIVWDVQKNLISLSTEAGRMLRPLYIVDFPDENDIANGSDEFPHIRLFDILAKNNMPWKTFHKRFPTFQSFIAPMVDDTSEGFIEYMDVDEIDKGMVAMFPSDLKRMKKGTTLPPRFTHCEIEPSLLNGVLAANIPFMDHNQAPRNCYQCLWIEEPVLYTDGSMRAIKDVAVGDEVLCFNLKTNILEPTKVIYHKVANVGKPIKIISVISGRRIVATHDHKFMTPDGWKCADDFSSDTKLYIYPSPISLSHSYDNVNISTDIDLSIEIDKTAIYSDFENIINGLGLGIGSLTMLHPKLPIIARLAGYMYICNPLRFASDIDKERFNMDVKCLGFVGGMDDRAFMIFMMSLGVYISVPSWVLNGTPLVRREYVNGYLGGYIISTNRNNIITDWSFVENIGEVTFFTNFDSWNTNNSAMMNVYSFAYSRDVNMVQMRKAEYEKYCKYMTFNQTGNGNEIKYMSINEWNEIVEIKGDMLGIPILKVDSLKNVMTADITVESDHHSFIGGDGFAVSNSAMGKQAVGIYMSNFNHRIDTMAHVLHYPQKPLVRTKLAKYTNSMDLPSGINAIVAIMTHTGFNQEDSVMLNKSAIDRGLFTSTYFKSYRDQCSKNHSTGEEEIFTKPVIEVNGTGKMKPFNYDKLGEDGFIPKNIYVDSHDILVGKVMPQKVQGVISERDTSLQVKGNDDGYVDMNYQGINGDGYKFCKIRMRKYRKPQVGDKLACYAHDHEYLTTEGWVGVADLTLDHSVATMVNDELIYQKPSELHEFDYKGEMICVKSNHVDLCVTPNHRMLYRGKHPGAQWHIDTAEEIYGKRHKYKKNVDKWIPDVNDQEFPWHLALTNGEITHFRFEGYTDGNGKYHEDLYVDIDSWLTLYGIYIAEGSVAPYSIVYAANKPRVQKALDEASKKSGLKITKCMSKGERVQWHLWCTHAVRMIGHGHIAITKSLQDWVWWLTRDQCKKLISAMCLGDGGQMANGTWRYYTSSTELANDFQRLCLHAGYSCNKILKEEKGHTHYGISPDKPVTCNADYWVLTIITSQNEPLINKYIPAKENQYSRIPFEGKVYCCSVPLGSGIVYVRRNGHQIWSGQSRSAQKGTIGMVYNHQDMPFSKDGISPDIIMNPHAIPSRMTIGQLMECIMGKACCHIGSLGDSTPFTDCSVESIANVLAKSGFERYGNEILYNGRTGEQMKTEIFIGPTYYQRLKHMVADKSHCLTMDHEVLTNNGWKFFPDITKEDQIATLKDTKLVYDYPIDLLYFPEYEGEMYHISNQAIDLDVTMNHRMWVSNYIDNEWSHFTLKKTNEIIGLPTKYMGLVDNNYYNEIVIDKNTIQEEKVYHYKGPVFCLQVPSEVFMVRKNGKSVWTGNSRGSNGPIVLLTRQPAEGRARNGGLRFGEMERDAIVAHGASTFLKERMLDVSDNFRVFICRQCGLLCTANPEKNIYKCTTCKNNADITQVRIPYAMKLLIQELMTMGVSPRITV